MTEGPNIRFAEKAGLKKKAKLDHSNNAPNVKVEKLIGKRLELEKILSTFLKMFKSDETSWSSLASNSSNTSQVLLNTKCTYHDAVKEIPSKKCVVFVKNFCDDNDNTKDINLVSTARNHLSSYLAQPNSLTKLRTSSLLFI